MQEFLVKRLRRAPIIEPLWDEFERMAMARDTALLERDAALTAREAALLVRDAAVATRDAALIERDSALAARFAALLERDAALARSNPTPIESDASTLDALIDTAANCDAFLAGFDKLWETKQSHKTFKSMEEAIDIALAAHPDCFRLKLYKAILPVRRKEFMDTALRCLNLARDYPDTHWVYLWGVPAAIAAADYDTTAAFVELALPFYQGWTPDILLTMVTYVGQMGDDQYLDPFWSFLLRQYPSEIPPHILSRTAWFCHNTRDTLPLRGVRLISLGEDCFSWARLAAWGLRRRTRAPEEQMPLNLGVQSLRGCLPLLQARFENFTDPQRLRLVPDGDGCLLPFHRELHFGFNHEVGPYWTDNTFERLRARYDRRVQNFFSHGCAGPRVYVYYMQRTTSPAGIEDAIADLAQDTNYRIVFIDARQADDAWTPTHPRSCYLRAKLPSPGYTWWDREFFDSPEGVAFERPIHDLVRETMMSFQ